MKQSTKFSVLIAIGFFSAAGCCNTAPVKNESCNNCEEEFVLRDWVWGALGDNLQMIDSSRLAAGLVDRLGEAYEQSPYPPLPHARSIVLRTAFEDTLTRNCILVFDVERVFDVQVVFEVSADGELVNNFLISSFGS